MNALIARNEASLPLWHAPAIASIAIALVVFMLPQSALSVEPPPDGGYPNQNTAEGDNALLNVTSGSNSSAIGFEALKRNTTGDSKHGDRL